VTRVDDLFAAIAAYLRYHNSLVREQQREQARRKALRGYRTHLVYCRHCGRPITSGEGLFAVEQLREDRACVDHYMPF
jgi:hypothetical protein